MQYFERNILILLVFIGITLGLSFLTYWYFKSFSPLVFAFGGPAVILFFQTLWIMLNPYAIIYEDKFEIKKSIIGNKQWYFIDIKAVSEVNEKGFVITYNDDEEETISTTGIRGSHKKAFRDAVNHYVCKSLVVERADEE